MNEHAGFGWMLVVLGLVIGGIPLTKDAEKEDSEDYNADVIHEHEWVVVAVTPGGTYGMLKKKWPKNVFGHELCDSATCWCWTKRVK